MKQLIKSLKNCKSVAVFGHQSPDGDCLGSISAISFLLKKLGATNVDLFVDDDIIKKYQFMEYDVNKKEFNIKNYDTIITVDVAAERLLGKYIVPFKNFENTIVIDHHKNRDLIGKINYIDDQKPSCAEIVYDIYKNCKVKPDEKNATMLYMGVVDDTACFLHDSTTSSTHQVAVDLIDCGADLKLINYNIMKLQTLKSFEVNKILDNQIVFDENVYYIVITEEFMTKNNFKKEFKVKEIWKRKTKFRRR